MTAATPRLITPAARKQSWREIPVRACTVLTLGVLIVIASVGISGIRKGLSDRRLIANGTHVLARVEDRSAGQDTVDAIRHDIDDIEPRRGRHRLDLRVRRRVVQGGPETTREPSDHGRIVARPSAAKNRSKVRGAVASRPWPTPPHPTARR